MTKKLDIEIEDECREDFHSMERIDRQRRWCPSCEHAVHDLSSMTRREVRRLLDSEENLCLRAVWKRGELVTLPENSSVRQGLMQVALTLILACPLGFLPGCEETPVPTAVSSVSPDVPVSAPRKEAATLPGKIEQAEIAAVARLKNDYGMDVQPEYVHTCDPEERQPNRRPVRLDDALRDVERLQLERDERQGTERHAVKKLTLKDAIEDVEMLGGCRRPRLRGRRDHQEKNPDWPEIEIIRRDD